MFPRVEHYDSSSTPAYVVYMASIACNHTSLYAPTWIVSELKRVAAYQGRVELVRTDSFSWHVDMDHLEESWTCVKNLGLKEAFAIQKLDVRCRSYDQQESDPQQKEEGKEEQEPQLVHEEL